VSSFPWRCHKKRLYMRLLNCLRSTGKAPLVQLESLTEEALQPAFDRALKAHRQRSVLAQR
jgi:hypothetical protein